jgi:hypothetical protein
MPKKSASDKGEFEDGSDEAKKVIMIRERHPDTLKWEIMCT